MIFLIFLILFSVTVSLNHGKELNCEVQYGLYCRIVFQDMENDTEVTVTVPSSEIVDQITTVSIIASKMSDVPNGIISTFPTLSNFVLRENDLKNWKPEYINNADNLKLLYITENPLTSLPDKAFINSPNLSALAITFTQITYIQPNVFIGLTMLENLDLNNNPIGINLSTDTFKHLEKNLKRLRLDDIGLSNFPIGFFDGFEQLDALFLKDNLFIEINAEIFPNTLRSLEIREMMKIDKLIYFKSLF